MNADNADDAGEVNPIDYACFIDKADVQAPCSDCRGVGRITLLTHVVKCEVCGGTGVQPKARIPAYTYVAAQQPSPSTSAEEQQAPAPLLMSQVTFDAPGRIVSNEFFVWRDGAWHPVDDQPRTPPVV